MLLDAVYLAVRNISAAADLDIADTVWWRNTGSIPEKENFFINWRPTSERIVIIFSDEVEQSYLRAPDSPEGPQRPITEEVVQDAVRAGINLRVYSFSTGAVANRGDFWTDISLAGNGSNFELTSDALSMYNDLMSIIDEACLPRQEQVNNPIMSGYHYVSYLMPRYDFKLGLCY